jgi:hypothetical protein
MVDATDPPPALTQTLEQHGQQHLLASWDKLSTSQREDLVSSLKVSRVMQSTCEVHRMHQALDFKHLAVCNGTDLLLLPRM